MTYTKPQPGPNKFSVKLDIDDGTQETHEFYAFFMFDKDPEGTEFWEINQIVATDGDTIIHPGDYLNRTAMPPREFTLPECQQIWEVMQETFYPE
jgi:hypothetical protein